MPPVELPPVIVRLVITSLIADEVTVKIGALIVPPLTVTRLASVAPLPLVAPLIVVFDGIVSVALLSVIVLAAAELPGLNTVGSNVIMPPTFAELASAARSEPAPESSVLLTTNVGGGFTVSVKFCCAAKPTPLLALIANWNVLLVVLTGAIPASVAVPSPLSVSVTPLGNGGPPRLKLGTGYALLVTVNVPYAPAVNVVLFALVITGV